MKKLWYRLLRWLIYPSPSGTSLRFWPTNPASRRHRSNEERWFGGTPPKGSLFQRSPDAQVARDLRTAFQTPPMAPALGNDAEEGEEGK